MSRFYIEIEKTQNKRFIVREMYQGISENAEQPFTDQRKLVAVETEEELSAAVEWMLGVNSHQPFDRYLLWRKLAPCCKQNGEKGHPEHTRSD